MQKYIKQSLTKLMLMLAYPCLLCLVSCEKSDWYDVKSNKSYVVPSTLDNFQAILDNYFINQNFPAFGEIGADDHYVSTANIANLTSTELNAYTWSHDQPYVAVRDWAASQDGAYTRIYYANLVLDGLKKLSSGSSQYNDVMGQALFTRAINFYVISQVFAPPYVASTAKTDLGIPLRLESDVNVPSKRSTLEDTYAQIIADFKQAETLLPTLPV